jgi:hypothetical protein
MQKFLLSALALLLIGSIYQSSYSDSKLDAFTNWCIRFNKHYSSSEEFIHRYAIYSSNAELIA